MKTRFFFTSYLVGNLGLVLYGLLALLRPSLLLEAFTLHVYQFPAEASIAVNYLSALFRLLGFFNLILGSLNLLLLHHYRVSQASWVMPAVVFATLLGYLGPIIFDNTVGSIGLFEIIEHFLFAILVLSGLTNLRRIKQVAIGKEVKT